MSKQSKEHVRWNLILRPGKGEIKATELLKAAGFEVHRQHQIGKHFVDIALPDYSLVVEVDAASKMARSRRRKREQARERDIVGHGWKVVRVLSHATEDTVTAVLREMWAPMRSYVKRPTPLKKDTRPNVIKRREFKQVEVVYLRSQH